MQLQTPLKVGAGALSKITNSAIFLGTLYGIVFLVGLPIYLSQGYQLSNIFTMALYMVLVVVITHIATNGLYYLVVVVPAIMATLFFLSGAALWLFAPVVGIFFGVISDIMSLIPLIGAGIDNTIAYSVELITRVGQALMAVAGGLWWLVSKAKEINYKALYIYFIFLALVSIGTGFLAPSLGMLMLLLWATLSFKVKDDSNHGDNLKMVAKIAAQATVVVTTIKTVDLSTEAWYGTSTGLVIYAAFFFIVATFGIWQPKAVMKMIPESVKDKVTTGLKKIKADKIGKIYSDMFFIKGGHQ